MTPRPRTKQDDTEQQRRQRGNAITLLNFHAETIQHAWVKRREVDHVAFRKVLHAMQAIGNVLKLTPDQADAFGTKMSKCHSGEGMINVEGNRVYIEGYYDLNKLKQEFLW